jgi:WD40 repeat protein/serine/threonine protein kinase
MDPAAMKPTSPTNGDAPEPPIPEGRRVGPYRLIRELGRGSQGQVFLAEDTRLSRRVALKVLSTTFAPSSSVLHRFQREAAAASKLDHPGICSVYEAGTADGVPYIAMRHVEGETLARQITSSRENAITGTATLAAGEAEAPGSSPAEGDSSTASSGTPPSSREEILGAVHLIERAARALHSAHEAGLIHRDIKPGNIMVTPEGDPVILDFGLARDEDSDLQTITHSGDLLGTPAYMSPEQLLAQRIPLDRRTDVYSLGVTLYERLTLRRPFDAPTREGLYQKILTGNAPDPRRLNSHIPRDLKVVLETALERDRARRYKTAFDFAEDLRRVRSYEPIKARPAGPLLRFQRWTQRNPVLATATLGLFLLLASGLAISLVLLREVAEERRAALKESTEKAIALADREAALSAVKAESAAKEEALRRAEGLYLTAQASSVLRDDPGLGLVLAVEGARRQPATLSRNILLEALQACRELRTLIGHEGPVLSASFSPDGARAITASEDATARIWDAASGKSLVTLRGHQYPVTGAGFSPDGRRALTSSDDGSAAVWDASSGRRIATLMGHRSGVTSAAFSPDGESVLTASLDGTARIWEAATGRETAVLGGHPLDHALQAAWSPDGRRVLTLGDIPWPARSGMSALRLWDAKDGTPLAILSGHEARISSARFRPDGKRILTASADQTARFWDAGTGELAETSRFGVEITDAAFSPDGRLAAAAAADGKAHIWDDAAGKPIAVLEGHQKPVRLVRFRPGGGLVLTVADDATARLWDPATGKEVARFTGHQGPLVSAAFSPGGERVITASRDGTARIWDADPRRASVGVSRAPGDKVRYVSFSPDAQRLLFLRSPATASTLLDPSSGAEVAVLREAKRLAFLSGEDESMATALFSPDGRWALTASSTGAAMRLSSVAVWDARTGNEVPASYGFYDADFSPDGTSLLAHFPNSSVGIFRFEDGRAALQDFVAVDFSAWISSVACSGGKHAAITSVDMGNTLWKVTVRDVESLRQACFIQFSAQRQAPSTFAVLSPAGDRLLVAFPDGRIELRDTATGKVLPEFRARSNLLAAQWSSDGGKLLALGADGVARVLDAGSGKVLGDVGSRGARVLAAALDPAAERIVALHGDDAPTVWSWATGERLFELSGHGAPVTSAAFGPGGREIITSSEDRTARIWNAATGVERGRLEGHVDAVLSAAFDAEGRRAITASADNTARIWDASSGQPLATIKKKRWSVPLVSSGLWTFASTEAALFSPDGRLLLVTSADEGKVWDGRQGKLVAELAVERGCTITAAAFRRDGKRLATGHRTLWDDVPARGPRRGEPPALIRATDPFVRIWEAESGRTIATLRGLDEPPAILAFSPSGESILGASAGGIARLWDAERGRTIASLRFPGTVLTLEFSPQGDRVLVTFGGNAAQVWGIAEASSVATLSGHTDAVASARFSPDGELAVTASLDGTARIWSASTGMELAVLKGHRGRLSSAEWSPSGRWVVTASDDRTARLWDVARKEEVIALPHPEPVLGAGFTSGGDRVLTVSRDLSARVWPVELVADLLAAADARRPRDLTPDEAASHEVGSPAEQAAYRRRWLIERAHADLEAAERKLDPRFDPGDAVAEVAASLSRLARALEGAAPGEAADAIARAERVVLATGRSDPDVLGALAEIQARSGRLRDAVLTLEEAWDLPHADASLQRTLDARRREVLPDLVSLASIDAAIDSPHVIIPQGAEWRYFPGRGEPSPGLEWTGAEFDDSAWLSGPSGFGFADGDDATTLPDMAGAYTTLYVRRTFDVPVQAGIERITLSVLVDDGFIAYLNGREVGRVRAPEGARIPFDGVASAYAREPLEATVIAIDAGLILAGRNVLAIQGLNHALTSTDFTLIPVLAAEQRKDASALRARFESLRGGAAGEDAAARLAYLEARILDVEGKREEAARMLEKVIDLDRTRPEPYLRLAEASLATKDISGAEAWLRKGIEAGAAPAERLWDRWFAVASGPERGRDARRILDALPGRGPASGRGADMRWALERLLADGKVRILCGGEERRDGKGALWGRDRFFQGRSQAMGPFAKAADDPEDPAFYQTGRRFLMGGARRPGYRVPVPPGRYSVSLKAAEAAGSGVQPVRVAGPGRDQRLFDILVEGRPSARFDLSAPGQSVGSIITADVTDGFLDIEVVSLTGEPMLSALVIEQQ